MMATVCGAKAQGRDRQCGMIKLGMDADLVLFDPETVCDNNDYGNPYVKNSGLDYVIVGGEIAVKDNVATGALGGRQLRKIVD